MFYLFLYIPFKKIFFENATFVRELGFLRKKTESPFFYGSFKGFHLESQFFSQLKKVTQKVPSFYFQKEKIDTFLKFFNV